MLLRDFARMLRAAPIKRLLAANILNQRTAVGIVGMCIAFSYSTLSNLDLFFNLTAFFVVFAYIMAMIALLANKDEWRSGHNYVALVGIVTALMIFLFATEGLIHEIIKLM